MRQQLQQQQQHRYNNIFTMIASTSNHQPDFCIGLVMLLEAAEHYNKVMATTPPCHTKKRGSFVITSSLSPASTSKIVYTPAPPKKRSSKHRSPFGAGKLSPIKKSSNLFHGGSPSSWKRLDFGSTLPLNSITIATTDEPKQDSFKPVPRAGEAARAIVLYANEDDHHINAIHNIVRRDIWEGFIVDASDPALVCEEIDGTSDARRCGRLARYEGTVGFRCRFCKNEPPSQRAERSAVYPRSLERIYHANIRFQRDHIEMCRFIPKEIKADYLRLKDTKGLTRGRKRYWVSSAARIGLCDGQKGIVLSSGAK